MNRILAQFVLGAAIPAALFATTGGGAIGSAGVPSTNPIDNSVAPAQTCARCHTSFPVNSPGGSVRIQAFHYRPGQRQTVRVTVSHPEAQKWGFQITARLASDLAARAGTFALGAYRVRCADTPAGRDITPTTPCPANVVEFAGHNADIVFGGANGSKTFEVDWIAPDTDVGDVVFYATGNAANNTTGNQGDRIYSSNLRVELEPSLRNCTVATRPSVRAVRNAASGGADVAFNTLVSIFGNDFTVSGTRREAGVADLRDGFPKEMSCIAVEIGGQRAPLTYVGPDQINAQIPTLAMTGEVPVRVLLNPGRPTGVTVDAGTIRLQNAAPAFFLNGMNVAAVHNTDGVLVGTGDGARPVRPGDIIQMYATGLGASEPVWQAGELPDRASPLAQRPTIMIGGTALAAADVLYAGLVPGAISGLYQINVRIPMTVADGNVPVMIMAGGVSSPAGTTIPVRR